MRHADALNSETIPIEAARELLRGLERVWSDSIQCGHELAAECRRHVPGHVPVSTRRRPAQQNSKRRSRIGAAVFSLPDAMADEGREAYEPTEID
ncbi:MAG: hypothetical protein VW644_01060 [Alphaproteobacteria bacterium]